MFFLSLLSDMIQERNALMEHVYPKLKKYCREKFQLEFQVWVPCYFVIMDNSWLFQLPHRYGHSHMHAYIGSQCVTCHPTPFYLCDGMLAQVLYRVAWCLCLSLVGVLSKRMDGSRWFLALRLLLSYLVCMVLSVNSGISRSTFSGTLS